MSAAFVGQPVAPAMAPRGFHRRHQNRKRGEYARVAIGQPVGNDRDGRPDDPTAAFHAGHLNDALRLKLPPSNPLLVASDTSGVWLIDENGGLATPLGWT